MSRKSGHVLSEFVERVVELGTSTLQSHLETQEEEAKVAMREVAHKICQEYGGASIYVPQDREWELQERDRQLGAEHAQGASNAELARRYKISTRQVQIILKHVRTQAAATAAAARAAGVVVRRGDWPFPRKEQEADHD